MEDQICSSIPKECFKFVVDAIKKAAPGINVLDVGCDQGQFLSYLHDQIPQLALSGMDIRPANLAKIPAVFYEADISNKATLRNKLFDIITMIGVHSEFQEIREWLYNVLDLGHKDTTYFIMGYFNPYDIDILVKYKRSGGWWEPWKEKGMNIISEKSVLNELEWLGYKGIFTEFEMSKDILPSMDQIRAWTVKNDDGRRYQINGASLILPFSLLTITKNGPSGQ